MGRDHSKIWSEFVKCTVNGRSGAQCTHCNVFYNFTNVTKMEYHILIYLSASSVQLILKPNI